MDVILSNTAPKIIPVFLLIFLGVVLRKKKLITESTIDDLKNLIINLILPCVLYFSFVNLELQFNFFILVVGMFVLCVLLFLLGQLLRGFKWFDFEYAPFLFTGFEFGMLGASLFGAVFGVDKVGYIGVIGLGHELFIWFVFVTFLIMVLRRFVWVTH